tara:strand:- start:6725 stop:8077 length:1353 start_codon:yes stop_codon:yes gene_type:complete
MPAIVTDALKRQIASDFFEQFTSDTKKYYIGVGRSEQWDSSDTVPTPVNTPTEISGFRDGLQSVKKVTGTSLVVPRNNWSSGRIYSQYDDQQGGYPTNPYYVMTDNNQVYICLETGRNVVGIAQPSTIEPTGSNNDSFRTADGYVWKFIFTVSAERGNDFMSSNFMPVQLQAATDSNSTGIQLKQLEIQGAAVAGEILSCIITNGGAGYTSVPSVTIAGTGSGALVDATIDSATGQLVRLRMRDSGASAQIQGSGYTSASVVITGGGSPSLNATARAVLGPDSGIGRDSREDLKSTSIMFHAPLLGTDSDFITDQDFRQVGLVRDPLTPNGAVFNDTTGNALYNMSLSSIVTSFTKDKTIEGATSTARAYIDNIDSNRLFYHQTAETGFGTFVSGETVEEVDGAGEGVVDSGAALPEVDPESGAILFIDNRSPVVRTPAQNEDIKVIIQF